MGIRFSCPNGHKLNVKASLAGKRALCPECGAKIQVPNLTDSATSPGTSLPAGGRPVTATGATPQPVTAETPSPSIVIALAESAGVDPSSVIPPPIPAAATPSPTIASSSAPAQSVVPSHPPMVKPAPLLSPDVQYQMRRERRRRNQMLLAIGLVVMVIVLAITLIWVLWRNASLTPARQTAVESESSTDGRESLSRVTIIASNAVPARSGPT